jgi:lipopolysaccharide export system protein LptA
MEADPAAAAAAAAKADKPQPATQQAADKTPKMRLKRVLATGHAKVESERLNIDASELSYDPVAQVLHARGTDGAPITIVDKQKGTTSTAGELEWNTATDQFHVKDLSGKARP